MLSLWMFTTMYFAYVISLYYVSIWFISGLNIIDIVYEE